MEGELLQEHDKVYEYLEKLGIYELRLYGRELGVQRPTGLKKKDLIEEIIKIGSSQKQIEGKSRRGAHPKSRIISEKEFEKLSIKADGKEIVDEIEKLLGGYIKKGVYNFQGRLTLQEDDSFKLFLTGNLEQSNGK